MAERYVGAREFKARMGQYLAAARRGDTIVITQRGAAVARVVPVAVPLEERVRALVDAGVLAWSGKRFAPGEPAVTRPLTRGVGDLVVEERG